MEILARIIAWSVSSLSVPCSWQVGKSRHCIRDRRTLDFELMSNLDGLRLALRTFADNAPLLLLYAQGCLEEFHLPEARGNVPETGAPGPDEPRGETGRCPRDLSGRQDIESGGEGGTQLIEERPDFAPAYVLLARILPGEGGVPTRAADLCAQALKLNPSVADSALAKELDEAKAKPSAARAANLGSQACGIVEQWRLCGGCGRGGLAGRWRAQGQGCL